MAAIYIWLGRNLCIFGAKYFTMTLVIFLRLGSLPDKPVYIQLPKEA